MTKKEFIELAEKHLTALEGYEIDENGDLELKIFGFDKLYEAINFTDSSLLLNVLFEKGEKIILDDEKIAIYIEELDKNRVMLRHVEGYKFEVTKDRIKKQ